MNLGIEDETTFAAMQQTVSELGRNESRVFSYLMQAGSVSSSEVSSELNIPVRTVRDVLKRLINKRLVESVGNGKNKEYRVADI